MVPQKIGATMSTFYVPQIIGAPSAGNTDDTEADFLWQDIAQLK